MAAFILAASNEVRETVFSKISICSATQLPLSGGGL